MTAIASKPSTPYATQALSVMDLIRAGEYSQAVERMQDLCRIHDPETPAVADAIRKAYEASRAHLKAVTPPQPFRVVVELVAPLDGGR